MSEAAINLATDIVSTLIFFGLTSVLWLPFLAEIVAALRRAWKGDDDDAGGTPAVR